jgi:hypothetical protein
MIRAGLWPPTFRASPNLNVPCSLYCSLCDGSYPGMSGMFVRKLRKSSQPPSLAGRSGQGSKVFKRGECIAVPGRMNAPSAVFMRFASNRPSKGPFSMAG